MSQCASDSLLNTLQSDAAIVKSLGNLLKTHIKAMNTSKLTQDQITILQNFDELSDDAINLYNTCVEHIKNKHITKTEAEKTIYYLSVIAENIRKAEELLHKLDVYTDSDVVVNDNIVNEIPIKNK